MINKIIIFAVTVLTLCLEFFYFHDAIPHNFINIQCLSCVLVALVVCLKDHTEDMRQYIRDNKDTDIQHAISDMILAVCIIYCMISICIALTIECYYMVNIVSTFWDNSVLPQEILGKFLSRYETTLTAMEKVTNIIFITWYE